MSATTVITSTTFNFVTRIQTVVTTGTGFVARIAIADFIARRTTTIITTSSQLETFEQFSE
jgi:hypothetical protein